MSKIEIDKKISSDLIKERVDNILTELEDDTELGNRMLIGISSYGSMQVINRTLCSINTGTLDFIGGICADFERIPIQKLKKLGPSIIDKITKKIERPLFSVFQFSNTHSGLGGEVAVAIKKMPKSYRKVQKICEFVSELTTHTASKVGLLERHNSYSGAVGPTIGVLCNYAISEYIEVDRTIETSTLPAEVDGIKRENKKIILAHQLIRGMPSNDLLLMIDNSLATRMHTLDKIDNEQALMLEIFQKGENLRGRRDLSDKISTMMHEGNGLVLQASKTIRIPIRKRGIINRRQVIQENALVESLAESLTKLCEDDCMSRYGLIKARNTKSMFLLVAGRIPTNLVKDAVSTADIPNDVDIMFLSALLNGKALVGAYHVTKNSIDSIDRFYGLELEDEPRSAEKLDELLPKNILENYATMDFPYTGKNYDYVYRKISEICGCDVDDVLKKV